MRNPKYPLVIFLFCLGTLFLILAGCTVQPGSPPAPTSTSTDTPIQTLSPTASPTLWLVDWPVENLNSDELDFFPWEDGDTLKVYRDGQEYWLNLVEGHFLTPSPIPQATPLFENPASISPNDRFGLECTQEKVILYQLPEKQVIGEFEGEVVIRGKAERIRGWAVKREANLKI